MVVERFSQNLINTGIFKVYIAIGFFATLIFFIFNTELFTPLQMLFGAVLVTVALKGLSNFMLSFIVNNFSLDQKKQDFDFRYNEEKIDLLLNQLVTKDVNDMNEMKEEEILSEKDTKATTE
ncbi:hypothetical protein ACNSOP_01920 [Aliarcobacter lanthieri]|uniref:hypothetical protein n=1 Tax=Arcobacteraceae TaxID=2808963 RepID=UPI000DEBC88B|nr:MULTISPECIES: hypothetical protein [Arcobacteraceae]MBL3519865.1 hypothetical protein [Aliarcobacter lanthieri]RBQ25960.1 hypothetical protein CRU88_09705 [Arcobacter sp. CECT 9188]